MSGKFDPDAFIEVLRIRVATDEEIAEAEAWAASFDGDTVGVGQIVHRDHPDRAHPLVKFVFDYTAKTRVTEHYNANFRKVNMALMPHVVKLFHKPKA